MGITEHFRREEFDCHDGTNYPQNWVESRLAPLCKDLEIIRAATGGVLHILSGYRTKTYNEKVGGGEFSQHKEGKAGDLSSRVRTPQELYALVLYLIADKKIKDGGVGLYHWGVHYDHGPKGRRWKGKK